MFPLDRLRARGWRDRGDDRPRAGPRPPRLPLSSAGSIRRAALREAALGAAATRGCCRRAADSPPSCAPAALSALPVPGLTRRWPPPAAVGDARLDRPQGRRPLLRRRLRDRPADAGRRRPRLPLDDQRQFLNAVALGQVTPGPVVATVAAVGYAAHGIGGGLLRPPGRLPPLLLLHPSRRRPLRAPTRQRPRPRLPRRRRTRRRSARSSARRSRRPPP